MMGECCCGVQLNVQIQYFIHMRSDYYNDKLWKFDSWMWFKGGTRRASSGPYSNYASVSLWTRGADGRLSRTGRTAIRPGGERCGFLRHLTWARWASFFNRHQGRIARTGTKGKGSTVASAARKEKNGMWAFLEVVPRE